MEKNPGSLDATATYVQMLGYQSDWDALITASDSALVRFPKEISFYEMKNAALYNKKDWQGIIDNSRKIIAGCRRRHLRDYSRPGEYRGHVL